jgi:hypothetical protein
MATSAAYIDLDEGAAPATPDAGKRRVYAKTDGVYEKDDAGTEAGPIGSGGGGGGAPIAVGVRVKRASGDVSLPTSGTPVAIPFDAEDDDTDGFHDNVTNNTRLTVPSGKAGVYEIVASALILANSDLRIRVNGTTEIATVRAGAGAASYTGYNVVAQYRLAVGDYVEALGVPQASSRSVLYSANISPIFSMYLIGS